MDPVTNDRPPRPKLISGHVRWADWTALEMDWQALHTAASLLNANVLGDHPEAQVVISTIDHLRVMQARIEKTMTAFCARVEAEQAKAA